MPYENVKDLPESVQKNLPEHAQKIYLEASNNAWEEYANQKIAREEPQGKRRLTKLPGQR